MTSSRAQSEQGAWHEEQGGYRCIWCGSNVNDWPDQPCVERRSGSDRRVRDIGFGHRPGSFLADPIVRSGLDRRGRRKGERRVDNEGHYYDVHGATRRGGFDRRRQPKPEGAP